MKKTTLFMLLLACTGRAAVSAQSFYYKLAIGQAFSMPGQTRDQFGNSLNGNIGQGSVNTYELSTASFSSGMHGALSIGYMFSKNIGIELTADVNVLPTKYTISEVGLTSTNSGPYNYTAERQAKGNAMLTPSLVLQTANKKWNLYMKMGLALPINSEMKLHETGKYVQSGNVIQYNWKIKNYFSPGFTAATGIKAQLGGRVSLFAEYSILYMALYRKDLELENAVANGTYYAASAITGIVKHYSYNKSGSAGSDNLQTFSQPFSNMAVNIGVIRTFGNPAGSRIKKHKEKKPQPPKTRFDE